MVKKIDFFSIAPTAKNISKRKNYTKYIAIREMVEVREQKKYDLNAATTKKQNEVIIVAVEEQLQHPENAALANTIFSLFANLSKCISEDYQQRFQSGRLSVDKKLRRMILEKKQALGLKEEHLQNQEQSY